MADENAAAATQRDAKKRPAKGDAQSDDPAAWPIEKCFEELEQIVAKLENQTTSLEESLRLFEQGVKLSRRCTDELTSVERKIQLIIENASGQVEAQDFEPKPE